MYRLVFESDTVVLPLAWADPRNEDLVRRRTCGLASNGGHRLGLDIHAQLVCWSEPHAESGSLLINGDGVSLKRLQPGLFLSRFWLSMKHFSMSNFVPNMHANKAIGIVFNLKQVVERTHSQKGRAY